MEEPLQQPVNRLFWRIVSGVSPGSDQPRLPASVLTIGPAFDHESMPHEAAILLPTNAGPTRLIEQLINDRVAARDAILGLFLAHPFLNVKIQAARLSEAGFTWITNLPSVAQHDEEFSRQLSDVDLGYDRELVYLAQFRAEGFRIAAVVSDDRGAADAAAVQPDVMIVLPRVADFAAGFPSLRQRSSAVQTAAEAAREAGWSGPLLGLGEAREADNPSLWPARLDGLICRPVSVTDDAV